MTAVMPRGGKHRVPRSGGQHRYAEGVPFDATVAGLYEHEQAQREHMAVLPDDFGQCLGQPRHSRDLPTESLPRVGELPLLDWLTATSGIAVDLVSELPAERCQWCLLPGQLIAVRIHGEPADDDTFNPLRTAETCTRRMCVATAVRQALIEQNPNSRNKIRVEVALPMSEKRQTKVDEILAEELDPTDDNPVPRRGEGSEDAGTEGGDR